MQKKRWATSVAIILILTLVIGGPGWYQSAFADVSSNPGSVDDPLVTKGYVDSTVSKLVQEELEKLGPSSSGSTKLETVTVPLGTKLIVEDGGEIIIRTGKAIAYSSDANGLSDMTDGLDIKPGKAIGNNHLILNPRGERGVEADPKQTKGLIVLVRGAYKLK
ncbi:hypothetical protein [Cohnella lupini]|uniref:Uncharacterized protein n=1 Tax=Cohnella lupini TaxID=1294267 RepID=A0A3D9I795_9BACL|nr:hypothetical protein [Cohnella lupini]RED57627.1 hypothetical protein DFP95_110100 [Cohnella lupini]